MPLSHAIYSTFLYRPPSHDTSRLTRRSSATSGARIENRALDRVPNSASIHVSLREQSVRHGVSNGPPRLHADRSASWRRA